MGDRQAQIEQAVKLISHLKEVEVTNTSKFYLTKPWGKTDQQNFINSVIEIHTTLKPTELLKKLQRIENHMGRVRKTTWGERCIDIDVLLYDKCVVDLPHLCVPHAHLINRAFVLAPLLELNPNLYVPNKGNIKDLWNNLNTKDDILDVF